MTDQPNMTPGGEPQPAEPVGGSAALPEPESERVDVAPPPAPPAMTPPPATTPPPAAWAPAVTVGPQVFCHACGAQIDARAEICPRCGVRQKSAAPAGGKSKVVAGVLAILLGGIGIHKFYLGKIAQGVIYILFCWTFIPAIVGFIEGILYLVQSDEEFARKYG